MPRLPVLIALSLFLFSAFLLACGGSAAPADPAAPPTPTPAPTPAPTPTAAPTFAELKAGATHIAYDNLFRNNEAHMGKTVWYQGEIVQVIDQGNDEYQWLVDVTKVDYGWDDTVFIYYSGSRFLEEDIVEFVGVVEELVSYESVMGAKITVPGIRVTAVQLSENGAIALPPSAQDSAEPSPAAVPETDPAPAATPEPAAAADPTPTPEPAAAAEPTPTPTPEPTPTPMPLPPGSAVDNPVPAGSVLSGSDGTEVVVTGIVADAWELIQAENYLNDPPGEGNRFYMITVGVAYRADMASVEISSTDFGLIGDNRVVYDSFESSCGAFPVIPDGIGGELYPGGKTEGNICFETPVDEGNFILIYQPEIGATRTYLRVDPEQVSLISDLAVAAPAPNPENLALPAGMTLDNPVAIGGVLSGTDGTEITSSNIVRDAWPLLQAENPLNDPPGEGNRFYMVTVEFSYLSGSETIEASALNFSLIGDNRSVYDTWDDSCGSFPVIPNNLEGELFPGGKTQGNICFEVPQSETGFILIYQPEILAVASRRFLRLE